MRVVVIENMTLDGVMQSPARADEDSRDGFAHGGWAIPYNDAVMGEQMGRRMAAGGAGLLLGRRTYEDFHAVWPNRTDNPYTEVLNRTRKYVASRTLTEPLPWENSTLLGGDAADAVARLREEPGGCASTCSASTRPCCGRTATRSSSSTARSPRARSTWAG